tara:strand:+ start:9251 stop:9595 length:345 start_codon:yes stop_codon:yes gene_type:complete
MKINKRMLKQIIKEELGAMQEIGELPPGETSAVQKAPLEPEDPLQNRVQDALNKWKAGESILKTIDDPKEVIQLIIGIVQHLQTLNPDLSPSELHRTIDFLRNSTLPNMKRSLK